MIRAFEDAFTRWGIPVAVEHRGGVTQTKAFVQPIPRETHAEPFTVTALGAAEERCWRYLGPAGVAVDMGDVVTAGETRYRVRRAAREFVGDGLAYHWAVLVPEEAAV